MTAPLEPPVGRGTDVDEWLAAHGIVSRIPSLRSSDAKYSCEFLYYLKRRLGIVPAYEYSEALSLGTWMHKCLEHWHEPLFEDTYAEAIVAATADLYALADNRGWLETARDSAVAQVRKDADEAFAFWQCALDMPIRNDGLTLKQYLGDPKWRVLGRELVVERKDRNLEGGRTRSIAQFDVLLYNQTTNSIWFPDLKSTASQARQRALICPHEFQTKHYTHILEWARNEGQLQAHFGLPDDVRIGGSLHIVVQKPSIRLSREDCDYTIEQIPKAKGGYTEKRIPTSEPKRSNYQLRCLDWFKSEGKYHGRHVVDGPPVIVSTTPASLVLEEDATVEYQRTLAQVKDLATRPPVPCLFPRNGDSLLEWGRLSAYEPFYNEPPAAWPDIIQTHNFVIDHRD